MFARMGSIISSARKPAMGHYDSLLVSPLHIRDLPVCNVPPFDEEVGFYTCKNFRMATSEPPTPMKAPTAQNTARIVPDMDW